MLQLVSMLRSLFRIVFKISTPFAGENYAIFDTTGIPLKQI